MKNAYDIFFINFAFAGMVFSTEQQRLHGFPQTENGCELPKKVWEEQYDYLNRLSNHLTEIQERVEASNNAQGNNLKRCINFASSVFLMVSINYELPVSSLPNFKEFLEGQYSEDDPRGKYTVLFPLLPLILMNIFKSEEEAGWSGKSDYEVQITPIDINNLDQKSFLEQGCEARKTTAELLDFLGQILKTSRSQDNDAKELD